MSNTCKRKREDDDDKKGFAGRWRLDGQRVLITGSTKGIGKVTAEEMLSLGAHVIIHSRNQAEIDATVKALTEKYSGSVYGCAADVSGAEGRKKLVQVQISCFPPYRSAAKFVDFSLHLAFGVESSTSSSTTSV